VLERDVLELPLMKALENCEALLKALTGGHDMIKLFR
jgi:hypothetical protein